MEDLKILGFDGSAVDKITYFDVPTQVKFYDIDGDHYIGGIAYCGKIICGCCGGVIDLNEFYEDFKLSDHPDDVYPLQLFSWIDISNEIIG